MPQKTNVIAKAGEEEVEVMLVNKKFHLATDNPKYQFYERRLIPKRLWVLHNDLEPRAIELHRRILLYFKKLKDKPMHVAKNHERFNHETLKYEPIKVKEGEVLKFEDNGAVSIKKIDGE